MAIFGRTPPECPLLANANADAAKMFAEAFASIKDENIKRAILESGIKFVIADLGKDTSIYVRHAIRDDKTLVLHTGDFKYAPVGDGRAVRVRSLERTLATVGLMHALKLDISKELVDKALADVGRQYPDDSDPSMPFIPGSSMNEGGMKQSIEDTMENVIKRGIRSVQQGTPQQRLAAALSHAYSDKYPRLDIENDWERDEEEQACDAAAMQIYDMHIEALAKRKALKEQYQPSKTAFAINTEEGKLPTAQREYFEHVNALLKLLNASPKALNTHVSAYLSGQEGQGLDAAALRFLPASQLIQHFASGYIPMHEMFAKPAFVGAEKPLSPVEWIHNAILAAAHKFQNGKSLEPAKRQAIETEISALENLLPRCAFSYAQELAQKAEIERQAQIAQEKAARVQAEAEKQAEEKAKRAAEEEKKRAAFMAEPRSYQLSLDNRNIIAQLEQYGKGASASAARARETVSLIESSPAALDIRNEQVRELGDILLSPANLVLIAKAMGAGNAVVQAKTGGLNRQANADKLRNWCRQVPEIVSAIDGFLNADDKIIILATALLGADATRSYADLFLDGQRAKEKLQKRIAELEANIGDTSPEMLKAFADDKDVIELLAKRQKLEEEQSKIAAGHDILADEIWQAFQGKKVKRIKAGADMPTIEQEKDGKSPIPEIWLPLLNGEFQAVPSTNGDKYVEISSKLLPFMSFRVKSTAEKGMVAQEISKLRAECKLAQHLRQDCGFELTDVADQMQLRHPAYGIEVTLHHGDKERAGLYQAEERFQERLLQQRSMLFSLQREGIAIQNVDEEMRAKGPITLRHDVIPTGSLTLAPQGYMRTEDFEAAQKLLGALVQRYAAAMVPEEPPAPSVAAATTWQPDPTDTLMVFDANVLKTLAAARGGNGHTWLDLIKHTARLPNVKVIIPAVIADWEMQGKIATYDDAGKRTGIEQFSRFYEDPKHPSFSSAQATQKFLSSASRARMDTDGKVVHFEPGANQNIIIMETPGDKDLYAHMHSIVQGPAKEKASRFHTEIYHQGHGEKAIERIIKSLPFANPFVVVSNDLRYFRHDASHTSGQGMPVGHASLACYLDAEIAARAVPLQAMMREQEPLSIYRIAEELKSHWEKIDLAQNIFLVPYCDTGRHAQPGPLLSRNIYGVIAHGANLMQEKANGMRQQPAAGIADKTWGVPVLRKEPIQPTAIAPEHMQDRSQSAVRPRL